MASIRTARVVAAVAALPLAVALFSGVAAADGAPAEHGKHGSNEGVASAVGAIGKHQDGNFSTVLQQAVGSGALNQNNTTQFKGSKIAFIDQSKGNVFIHLTPGVGPKAHERHRP
ncbi:hypothetical protein GCM10010145_50000 [Streptomyces ruber]|uniref:Secreted protein n=2 Tax=Streptomyces TaxID=1883 RepID=A0A918EX16_9ACTN|nr:hypothetical protein [Streptomyces ruber]GGQ74333.1 hypothetical protein GCM10010145_50000 [Streptomyces ruber]